VAHACAREIAGYLAAAGLGLEYRRLRLAHTPPEWLSLGSRLREQVQRALTDPRIDVEHVGSTAVEGLLAKPVIDLAVGLAPEHEFDQVRSALSDDGWIYRGDAGDDGGHIFVLESRPWFRVAHAHVVPHLGDQWASYLQLRDLLRRSVQARAAYEATKLALAESVGDDRAAYTDGKTDVVRQLLASAT
jgi:GrpB-like predicted nucleotidyltransferase (UPF0157 family)